MFIGRRNALALLAGTLPLSVGAAPETYLFNPYETYPSFEVSYIGYTDRLGRFDKTAGKFTLDRAARTGSVEVVIQAASVNTGDNERGSRPRSRDEHLRTADFFNAAEFPTITYKATTIRFNGDAPSAIEGELTLLGVTRPLTLKMDSWKCAPHPMGRKLDTCGGNASGVLRRSDFGMKYGIPSIGDEIKLSISFIGQKE